MRNAWCLVLPLLLGCSGKHVVAGEDQTKSEQFAASLPSWCQEVCKTFASCPGANRCDCAGDFCSCVTEYEAECREECQKELGRYTSRGDTCAEVGLRYQGCLGELTCTELVDSKAEGCEPTDAEERQCPGNHDAPIDSGPSSPSGPSGPSPNGPPPSAGGTVATGVGGTGAAGEAGGTAGLGGATGGTGSAGGAPADPVSCQGAYGVGGTGSGSGIICEEGRMQCSDGHDYGWMCARGNNLELACSCFVDGALTRGFDPASESCPSVERVNAACGFYLPD